MTLGSVRIDRWLCASRLYKSRSLAQQACLGGLVKLNGLAVRPSHALKLGDEVSAECVRYLNRLSDLLFILSRAANVGAGESEPLWQPGRYRQ